MLSFIAGAFVGCFVGVCLMAVVVIAKEQDRD